MSGHFGTFSMPTALISTRETSSPRVLDTCQVPLSSSQRAASTFVSNWMCGTISCSAATSCKYARISAWEG
jgi:hypothetical protein